MTADKQVQEEIEKLRLKLQIANPLERGAPILWPFPRLPSWATYKSAALLDVRNVLFWDDIGERVLAMMKGSHNEIPSQRLSGEYTDLLWFALFGEDRMNTNEMKAEKLGRLIFIRKVDSNFYLFKELNDKNKRMTPTNKIRLMIGAHYLREKGDREALNIDENGPSPQFRKKIERLFSRECRDTGYLQDHYWTKFTDQMKDEGIVIAISNFESARVTYSTFRKAPKDGLPRSARVELMAERLNFNLRASRSRFEELCHRITAAQAFSLSMEADEA